MTRERSNEYWMVLQPKQQADIKYDWRDEEECSFPAVSRGFLAHSSMIALRCCMKFISRTIPSILIHCRTTSKPLRSLRPAFWRKAASHEACCGPIRIETNWECLRDQCRLESSSRSAAVGRRASGVQHPLPSAPPAARQHPPLAAAAALLIHLPDPQHHRQHGPAPRPPARPRPGRRRRRRGPRRRRGGGDHQRQ
jgi:hypothetical protein